MFDGTETARVEVLRRYPVKSMLGEDIDRAQISASGILGDRAFAIVDAEDGKVASAKNPRKWPNIFKFDASYVEQPGLDNPGVVAIGYGPGQKFTNLDADIDAKLSTIFGHSVYLAAQPPLESQFEVVSALEADRDEAAVRTVRMPEGVFFDSCVLHVLTTATLRHLSSLYPQGHFDVRRFRPNLVLDTGDSAGFVENDWIGRTISVGDQVVLRVIEPCRRCIMATLPQGDLPEDVGILRTAVKHNSSSVGVRVAVVEGGVVQKGDAVMLE